MGVKLINLEKGDTVMDVARVVNEDEEPRPIAAEGDGDGVQEIVASTALEEEILGLGDEDDELEEAPPSLDDLVDEIDTDDGPNPHDVTDEFRGEDES
jgi:hypothetical protein